MSYAVMPTETWQGILDALRAKNGSTALYKSTEVADAIGNLSTSEIKTGWFQATSMRDNPVSITGVGFAPSFVAVIINEPADVSDSDSLFLIAGTSDGRFVASTNGYIDTTASAYEIQLDDDGFTIATHDSYADLCGGLEYLYIAVK